MTEQKEHYDQYIARYRALLEHYGLSPPELTESTIKHSTFYLICRIIYAIEDSLSFLFGNIKLYFSLIDSYYQRSDSGASDDLHNSLQSLPDLLIIIGIGIPLALTQVLGAYFLESPDLKTNKYKYFFAKVLAPYLRDILQGIKWAYKGMRSVLNMIFRFMASHKGLILKILFPLSIVVAGLSVINRITLRTMRNFRKQEQSDNRKTSLQILEEGYVLKFRIEMPTEPKDLAKLKKSLVYVPEGASCTIYHVDHAGVAKDLGLPSEQRINISEQVQQFQSDNIRFRIAPEFIDENFKKLYFLEKIPEDYTQYKNSLIFLTDSSLDEEQRLRQIDDKGQDKIDPRSKYFIKVIKNEINNKRALNLYSHQIEEVARTVNFKGELGIDLAEWDIIKGKKEHKKISKSRIFFFYFCVILSALFDSAYFYIGVLFLAFFNPAAFIAMIAMSAIMIAVCLIGRIYEEYNYQKVFDISQIEINLNLYKTESNILCREIEIALEKEDDERLKELLPRLRASLQEYANQQKKLASKISISSTEAFLKGLRNGLSTQGVISSLMFMGVFIMLLTGTACPPAFIISMTVIGFAAMIRSIYRYMQSYQEYKKKEQPIDDITIPEIDINNLAESYENLKAQRQEIEQRIISKPPDLFEEEYSEVFRLVCSGQTKAEKNIGECTLGRPRHGEEWWLTLTSSIFSGGMALVFGFRGIHKMFSTSDENPNTIPNKGIKSSQEKPPKHTFFSSSANSTKDNKSSTKANKWSFSFRGTPLTLPFGS